MGTIDHYQKRAADIAEQKFSEHLRQQQQAQKTFRDDIDPNKKHLSRQASSMILLAIVVIIIVGIIVALQFLH